MTDKFENPILKTSAMTDELLAAEENDAITTKPTLSLCRKILFGLAAPPLQMTGNICGFFFSLFLLEVVHLSPLLVSVITFAGRGWDALTDPLVGQLVFRTNTNTKIGRTKPWMLCATLLGPITFFFMWFHVPGLGESSTQKFFYYFVCYLAYCTAITCYHVPYTSSTMLISNHSKDRDGATASRVGFELIFTIIGSLVFGVIISQKRVSANCKAVADVNETMLEEKRVLERQGYMLAAGIIALIYFLCGIFAVAGIKERVSVKQDRQPASFFKNIRSVLTFRPYLLLMFAFLFMSLGIQIVQANLGLYTTHSMQLGDHMQYGIITVLSVAVLCVPFWYKMAERFGKKKIFICGLVPMYPCLLFATFMPTKSLLSYYTVCAVSGLSISVAMLLPWSMLPDVIDEFYVQFGDRKESVFYSLYVFFTKFASGISLALSQLALSASGYNSDKNACVQPESVGLALRYLVGPGPVLCIAVSMVLMWYYPIDKDYRAVLDRKLQAKLGCSEEMAMDGDLSLPEADGQADDVCCMTTSVIIRGDESTLQPPHQEGPDSSEQQQQQQQQPQSEKPDTKSSGSGGSGSGDSGFEVEDLRSTDNLLQSPEITGTGSNN